MYSLIERKFASALQSGALIYTASTHVPSKSYGVDAVYTLAPALDKKPTKADNEKAPKDPWNPPEEELLVEKQKTHSVVLNKFALAKYHFLLVTNEFQPQTSPLGEDDWSSAMSLLKASNKESGKRHVGFYNCGPNSGASVAHKHIQMMTLPDNFKPFPDTVARKPKNQHFEVAVSNHPTLPFSHFIAFLESTDLEDVITSYYELLNRTFTELARNGVERKDRSFNVVFTEEWILVTPRSQEKVDGISINSLGTIGLILGKNDEQLQKIEGQGFDLVKAVGFSNEGTFEFSAEVDSHVQY